MASKKKPASGAGELRGELREALDEVRDAVRQARDGVAKARKDVSESVAAVRDIGPLISEVVRTVTDVDTIKALADPTRLSILRVLSHEQRAMSAKELAEELAEPQTKLYRHLKVLQEAGLIEVAETRIVSGIVETRYRAAQTTVTVDPSAHIGETGPEMLRLISIGFDDFRDRFLAYASSDAFADDPRPMPDRAGITSLGASIPEDRAEEFRTRLRELVAEFDTYPRDSDGTDMEALVAWFSPKGAKGTG